MGGISQPPVPYDGDVTHFLNGQRAFTAAGGGTVTIIRDADALGLDPYSTFFVDSVGGNNANDGLTDLTAWETLDYAIGYVASLRWAQWQGGIDIQLLDGSYVINSFDYEGFPYLLGADYVNINAVNFDPVLCTIDCNNGLYFSRPGNWSFSDIGLFNINGVTAIAGARVDFQGGTITFDSNSHLFNANTGGYISINSLTISCPPTIQSFAYITTGGTFSSYSNITITGTPDLPFNAFINSLADGYVVFESGSGAMFTGTATGKRFNIAGLSRIYTGNAGANFFPGDVAGTTEANSIYY